MKQWQTGLFQLWQKYKYFMAVIAVGAVLLVTSTSDSGTEQAAENEQGSAQSAEEFDLDAFQTAVAESLSRIEGAGRVEVLLSLETGQESVYAEDVSRSSQTDGGEETSESYQSAMSILSDGSYGESPVLITSRYPTFRGAVILCDGADSNSVKLEITQAVGALCGISSDHISISKLSQ